MAKGGKREKRSVKHSIAVLLLLLSLTAVAGYSRLDVDVSKLPAENAFLSATAVPRCGAGDSVRLCLAPVRCCGRFAMAR